MLGFIEDYIFFLKLLLFFFVVRWLMDNLGNNKLLFTIGLLVGTYYIFFARWSILGAVFVILFLFIMGGVGNFMQDIIFQYDSVRSGEMEAAMSPMEMLRRY